jgi:hypothetical protein
MYTKQIENKLIYGNAEGTPKNQGKCTTEFDEFLKPIMAQDIEAQIEDGKKKCLEATGIEYEILEDEYNTEKEF